MTAQPLPLYDTKNPFPLKTACSPGCGQCCAVVGLRAPKDAYRFLLDHVHPDAISDEEKQNARFIVEHFHEVDRVMAAMINGRRVAQNPYASYFLCDRFDSANLLCIAHEERPPFCRNFPFLFKDPEDETVKGSIAPYSKCAHWREYDEATWPDFVNPVPQAPWPDAPPKNCC